MDIHPRTGPCRSADVRRRHGRPFPAIGACATGCPAVPRVPPCSPGAAAQEETRGRRPAAPTAAAVAPDGDAAGDEGTYGRTVVAVDLHRSCGLAVLRRVSAGRPPEDDQTAAGAAAARLRPV